MIGMIMEEIRMTEEQGKVKNFLNRAYYQKLKLDSLRTIEKNNNELIEMHSRLSEEQMSRQLKESVIVIDKEIEKLMAVRDEIRDVINTLDNPEHIAIFSYRYLGYLTITEIAERMHYDKRTIMRKHIAGLNELSKKGVIECHHGVVL